MKTVKNHKFCICVLSIAFTHTIIQADAITFRKYDYYAGYQCAPKDTLFQSENVFDDAACGKLCHQTNKCLSFAYQPDDNRCIGCRADIFGAFAAKSQIVPGSNYYSYAHLEADCEDIKAKNPNALSGVHKIKLWQSKSVIDVYCDMETDGYGWTVFQNRFDGSVNFYRDCEDYENGFGSITGEFWLGLKYIQEISRRGAHHNSFVRIDLSRENGETGFEIVRGFSLVEGTSYTLSEHTKRSGRPDFSSGIAPVSEGRSYGNAPFSCRDRDRDEMVSHCAADTHGAWWHKYCSVVNLNGEYCTPGQVCDDGVDGKTGFYHTGFAGYESLKTSKMMYTR